MKTSTSKSLKDELIFILVAIVILVALSFVIFPLFILLLPLVLLAGCREIWFLDHLNDKPK